MTYASRSASFSGRSDAAAVSRPLHVFRGRKKDARSTSCKSPGNESCNLVENRAEVPGREAFQEMFVAARPQFVAMAHAILRNREDAEDAVQNAFLSGHRHLRSFEGRSALKTWFTRIVLNAALMILRKRTNSRVDSLPESSSSGEISWTERIPASQPDPEMVCAEGETFQLIDVLLGRMNPVLRQSFTMTYYDEMSNREACTLLGVSIETFKSRVFRARRHLMALAQRSLVAPIRRTAQSPFSVDKVDFQALSARLAETSSPEIAFS